MEWYPEKIVFSVDDVVHFSYNPPVKDDDTWPFDAEQYILLNVAILPNINPSFTEGSMEIDYVRVYQASSVSTPELKKSEDLFAYPVPFTNELTIQLNQAFEQEVNLSIYSMDGRMLSSYSKPVINNKIILNDLNSLPKGIYLIRLLEGQMYQSIKVIKD
jgi:beta-glucanase (GH16 family)